MVGIDKVDFLLEDREEVFTDLLEWLLYESGIGGKDMDDDELAL